MNGHPKTPQFAADLAAGAAIGGGVAWALASLFDAAPMFAAAVAGIAFVRVFWSLRRLHDGRKFALPAFEPATLEFDSDVVALDAVAASIAAEPAPETVAELPTVKQLQESIRQRLNLGDGEPADAADELRAAMRDLRRSIG